MSKLTDDELTAYLRENWHRGPLPEIVPESELPMTWRILEGLDWDARDELRQAAAAPRGRIRRWPQTRRGVEDLTRRGLLAIVKRTAGFVTYEITGEGRALVERLPAESTDSPLNPENRRAADRLSRCLHRARFSEDLP